MNNIIAIKRFFPYLMKYKKENTLALVCGLLSGASTVYITYLIGIMIDQIHGENDVNFSKLLSLLFLFTLIVLITVVGQWFIQKIGNQVAYLTVADLRKNAFAHLNQLPINYYDQTPHGEVISRFLNDMDNISAAISAIFTQIFSGLMIVFLSLIMMLKLSTTLTLVVLLITPLIFLTTWWITTNAQQTFNDQQTSIGNISSFIAEMVSNQKTVIAFNRQNTNQKIFTDLNQTLYKKGQKAQFISSLTNPTSRFIDHLAYLALGLLGAWLIFNRPNTMTIGIISSFTIYATQFTKPFIELSGLTTQIQTGIAGLARTFALLDEPAERPIENPIYLEMIEGKITFSHVSFSYRPDQPLIKDFNLEVFPGETIAIVGKTGAGKSTLVNLLMRFYDVDQGKITLDNIDIRQIDRNNLREYFGMVLQDTWLFDGTLRENLTYGQPHATDEEIYDALDKTAMRDFVERLPDKLETPIGLQGIKISVGQRQLLTIARTMIGQPTMLILDEATSSVDPLTEQKMQTAFLAMMDGRTSFIIAHRLATIKAADHILVMERGHIVEQGTHEELLAQQSTYYDLYHAQFEE